MTALSLKECSDIAQGVYQLRSQSVAEMHADGEVLGCEQSFKVDDGSRFSGRSGILFRPLSGYGYICEGTGVRAGEVLIATRGTHTLFDMTTDIHCGLRRGPRGHAVHTGFQRVWDSYAPDITAFLKGKNPSHVHCVGHSLGGALAHLNADYFVGLGIPATLYTFGCPRVGLQPFSQDLTQSLGADSIYRVAHSTDPVTMLPTLPFFHSPYRTPGYVIDKPGAIWLDKHYMAGYINSTRGKSWDSLANVVAPLDWTDAVARAWLDAVNSGQGGILMYSSASLEMITQALRWLLRKAAGLGFICACNVATGAFTAVDLLASMLTSCAELSKELSGDLVTIMKAILCFLGRSMTTVAELTYQFVRWVFDLFHTSLCSLASRALAGNDQQR